MIALSTAKGWLYVLITGALLYFLVQGELSRRAGLETKLREGLEEKGTLLVELNHRVKNNLQVISSILSLETEYLKGAEARTLNDRNRARIRTLCIAYERLFEGSPIARLNLGGYLRDLWEVMTQILEDREARATFEIEEVVAGAEAAVPFGLFAAEAMTNAILHGAGPAGNSEVAVGLRAVQRGDVELTIKDAGPGLPEGAQGLGLRLMDALGQQLGGRVERRNEGGTLVRLVFNPAELGRG